MNHSFPYSDTNKRYHTYDYYLKHRYGTKCARIPIDAGFSCPNREGGRGGCTFCSARGSGDFCAEALLPPEVQFATEYARLTEKWGKRLPAIPYFQAFSNTYASTDRLRQLYEAALCHRDADGIPVPIPALAIATRPDCLTPETVALLCVLHRRADITVELGLQSIHDTTLHRIRRGHDLAAFLDGYRMLADAKIPVCVHIINGLPGETREMMLETVRTVAALRLQFIKIHMLHILRGTVMAEEYARGEIPLLSCEEYVSIVCRQLELLPPETVICRLTGDGAADDLLAPDWTKNKRAVLAAIDKTLAAQNTCQGAAFSAERTENR